MVAPDFGGDEHRVALDARRAQALADLALVAIHLGGIDMAVAEAQGLLDDARTGALAQVPGTEADRRNPRAVGGDIGHRHRVARAFDGMRQTLTGERHRSPNAAPVPPGAITAAAA